MCGFQTLNLDHMEMIEVDKGSQRKRLHDNNQGESKMGGKLGL